MVRVDTGTKLHMATESAYAAGASCSWKCDSPSHLAPACPHASAIKDVVAKRNAARKEKTWKKKSKPSTSSPSSSADAADASTSSDPLASESAGVAACFLTTAGPVSNDWLCDTGASCSMSGRRSAFVDFRVFGGSQVYTFRVNIRISNYTARRALRSAPCNESLLFK